MADFNQFATSDEENAEIKKLTLEVVWNNTPIQTCLCILRLGFLTVLLGS